MNQPAFEYPGNSIESGSVRPGHIVSLTGFEHDAAEVIEVEPSLPSFTEITITLETGVSKTLPIEFPVNVFEE